MNPTTILVVEDTLDLLNLYSIWLRQAGYKVLQASTGFEGLRLVAEELPDLVLLDVMLPDIDGIEVCRIIRSSDQTAAIPVINISGRRTSPEHEVAGLEAGAGSYLVKPIESPALLAHVNALLRNKHAEQKLRETEQEFRASFDNAWDAILIADDQSNLIDVNPAACSLFELSREELLKRGFLQLVPDLYWEFDPDWQSFLAQGVVSGEFRLKRSDGTIRDVQYQARARFHPDRHLWVLRDITERRKTEEILRQAQVDLEDKVAQRTVELLASNIFLRKEIAERKQTQEALSKAKETLETIFDAAPVAILGLDLEGQITNWSSGARRMFGWTVDEAIGRTCPTVPEDGLTQFHEMIAHVVREGPQTGLVYDRQKKNGERIQCSISGGPLRNSAGEVTGVMVILQDITELRQQQEELRRSAEQYRELVENINDILYATNEQGVITYISQGMEYSTGLSASEIIGHSFEEFIHPEDLPQMIESFQQSASGHPRPSEFRIFDKFGKTRWLRKSSRPVFYGKMFAGTRGLLTDITERKSVEEALRKSEGMLEGLFEFAPDSVVVVNQGGNIIRVNAQVEQMFGYARDELAGKPIELLIPEALRRDVKHRAKYFEELHTRPMGAGLELRGRRKDGTEFPVDIMLSPMQAENRGMVIAVVRDVTERKKAEDARKQLLQRIVTAQEEEQRRLSRELHDQTGQSIAALLLGLKSLADSDQFKSTEINRLHQLQELTNQLAHDVHHLASSLRPTALDDLGLHTALSNHVEEWSERSGIRADFHSNGLIQGRLPPQVETTVYRIVQEALTNIVKHAKAQNVSIILEHRGNRVMAIVEDDGSGFEVETMLEKPISERRLGLMGMKERASLVNGKLDIESTSAGTTVIVNIPLTATRLEDPLEETTDSIGR